jgi:hypothetical protein
MVLNGVKPHEEYGKVMAWGDHPDAFDWMHTRKQFLPGEGLLILESQQRVLNFLVKCCQLILHEIPFANLTTDTFPCKQEPRLKAESDSVGFVSLAAMADEAPYRVPFQLDLGQVESLHLLSSCFQITIILQQPAPKNERPVFVPRYSMCLA